LPGRTPREAVEAFLDPLRETISCIAATRISASPGGYKAIGRVHSLVVNGDRPLSIGSDLELFLRMAYEIVECEPDDPRGRYRVSTKGYDYQLRTSTHEVVVSWHWHPDSRIPWTHLHVGKHELRRDGVLSDRSHISTGRISIESLVRQCITDLGAKPLHEDWSERLARREGDFLSYRSWP
jgi:hypothetical protein